MARSLNKVMLIGNITQDPEVRQTPTGQNVCTIGVATNRSWIDKASGQRQDRAEFHSVVMWGRLAEIAGEYLRKGRQVFIEGRLETRSWEAQDGTKRYRTEVIAENMLMLGTKRDSAGSSSEISTAAVKTTPISSVAPASDDAPDIASIPGKDEIRIEDVPF